MIFQKLSKIKNITLYTSTDVYNDFISNFTPFLF